MFNLFCFRIVSHDRLGNKENVCDIIIIMNSRYAMLYANRRLVPNQIFGLDHYLYPRCGFVKTRHSLCTEMLI
jgi:hypothetical protein